MYDMKIVVNIWVTCFWGKLKENWGIVWNSILGLIISVDLFELKGKLRKSILGTELPKLCFKGIDPNQKDDFVENPSKKL